MRGAELRDVKLFHRSGLRSLHREFLERPPGEASVALFRLFLLLLLLPLVLLLLLLSVLVLVFMLFSLLLLMFIVLSLSCSCCCCCVCCCCVGGRRSVRGDERRNRHASAIAFCGHSGCSNPAPHQQQYSVTYPGIPRSGTWYHYITRSTAVVVPGTCYVLQQYEYAIPSI